MAVVLTYMFPHLCDNFPRLQTACESTKSKRDIFGIHLPDEASKCLLVGENGSGKSSLLFQCALSYASEGNKVVYITHSKLQTMPLQVHGTSRPDAMLMKQVQLLYLVDREALLDYLSSIHTIALPPHVIIVDDLDYYCKPSQVLQTLITNDLVDHTFENQNYDEQVITAQTNMESPNKPVKKPAQTQTQIQTQTQVTHVKTQTKTIHRSKGCQVEVEKVTVGIQCDLLKPLLASTPINSDNELEGESEIESSAEDMSVYIPETETDESENYEDDSVEDESDEDADMSYQLPNTERKFIIFESCLLQLFNFCIFCLSFGKCSIVFNVQGTLLKIEQFCKVCQKKRIWHSQPYIGQIPLGNLLLSASILFTGSLPTKTLRMLNSLGVCTYNPSTYFRHQRQYLLKTISNVWQSNLSRLQTIKETSTEKLIIGGDARCDSMGHSAKYGSYTLMDLKENKIIAMELVQSNEVGGSYHMELEGLKRCLAKLANWRIHVTAIVTDRHLQIRKWLAESCDVFRDAKHFFDVWHVAKGITKKITTLAKRKSFGFLRKWSRSIVNHLYWCANSSDGVGELVLAKWESIVNHIQNVHTGHGDIFPECMHAPLSPLEQREWFEPGTEVFEKLSDILLSKFLKKDILKLSPHGQTSAIEGYHSLINHFAPKMSHFSYNVMKARLSLAALHFNENSNKDQAMNEDGKLQYAIRYPKFKYGGYSVVPITTRSTFDYIDMLYEELYNVVEDNNSDTDEMKPPPNLCSGYERPDKDDAIKQHFSRFSKDL